MSSHRAIKGLAFELYDESGKLIFRKDGPGCVIIKTAILDELNEFDSALRSECGNQLSDRERLLIDSIRGLIAIVNEMITKDHDAS